MDDPTPIRLLLVSRHTLIRAALARLLAQRPEFDMVAEAGTRAQALAHAAHAVPDVILLRPEPGGDLWLDAIDALSTAVGPQSRVLLLSELVDPEFQRQAVRHGAHGIVDLDHPPATLFRAIERVHAGDIWMERRLMAALLSSNGAAIDDQRLGSLTPRERDVVRLVSEGLKNKQIAQRLSVADVTVRHHLTSVFSRLDVAGRSSLVVFAFRHGLAPHDVTRHNRS
jgi:two-component system, NarL family, nitrate/nitrite response regulator NarL